MNDPRKPVVLDRRKVFTGKKVRVNEIDIKFKTGEVTYEIVDFEVETGVSALPILNDKVLLIRHYQAGIDDIGYSLPTGGLEKGENPKERMQQELQEEIGYKAEKLALMIRTHAMPGYVGTAPAYIYLAEDLIGSRLPGDEDYEIEVVPMKLEEALRKIESSEIVDGRTCLALLYYDRFVKKQ